MTLTALQTSPIELDQRSFDGIDVRLYWNPAENTVTVAVNDSRTGDAFEAEVPADKALDAFNHPFVYRA